MYINNSTRFGELYSETDILSGRERERSSNLTTWPSRTYKNISGIFCTESIIFHLSYSVPFGKTYNSEAKISNKGKSSTYLDVLYHWLNKKFFSQWFFIFEMECVLYLRNLRLLRKTYISFQESVCTLYTKLGLKKSLVYISNQLPTIVIPFNSDTV